MNLLATLDPLISSWRDGFPPKRTCERARRLVFGLVVRVRMHLTSNAICATGRQFVDWTADYRVCSRSPWDPHGLLFPAHGRLSATPEVAAPGGSSVFVGSSQS